MKNQLFKLFYETKENQVTEVLFKLLQKGTPELTELFLHYLFPELLEVSLLDFEYITQVNGQLEYQSKKGFLLAISETGIIKPKVEDLQEEGVPDGLIYERNHRFSVLVEVKIGSNPLNQTQLNAHKNVFSDLQHKDITIISISWLQIRKFFQELQTKYDLHHRNSLLLEEFQYFCDENEVGLPLDYPHQSLLSKYDPNQILKKLDTYILKRYPTVSVIKEGVNALNYKDKDKKNTSFFTIWYSERKIVFKPSRPYGAYIDLVIRHIGGTILKTPYDYKAQESFMLFSDLKEENISILYQLINFCYETSYNGKNTTPRQWVNTYSLNKNDLNFTRITRDDQPFLDKRSFLSDGKEKKLLNEFIEAFAER